MAEPYSAAILAGINTSFKLAEFGLKLADASEDNRFFCKLIARVRKDRVEAMRERREKAIALKDRPSKKEWIDGTIFDCEEALQVIGKLVENARVDEKTVGGVTLKHRFEWVLKKKDAFLTKQSHLATCHLSLMAAVQYMQTLPADHRASLRSLASESSLLTMQSDATMTTRSPPPSYLHVEEEDQYDFVLRSPSRRRPVPRQAQSEYYLPEAAGPSNGRETFSEDLERTIFERLEPDRRREPAWDENISGPEVLSAAAAAIKDSGGNGRIINEIAEQLRPTISNERRKRNEARFAYT